MYVARLLVKMYVTWYNRIGLCAQDIDIVLGSIGKN